MNPIMSPTPKRRVSPKFSLSPGWSAALTAIPFLLLTPVASALTIISNGDVLNIDESIPLDDYSVTGSGSTLNASGANLAYVTLVSGGTFNMNGGTVNAGDIGTAVELASSFATINNATVSSDEIGLSAGRELGNEGSRAQVTGSTIEGGEIGARVTGLSTLQLDNSRLVGSGANGIGLRVQGGNVLASNASAISGANHGVVFARDTPEAFGDYRLTLDNSSVIGTAGAAIQVAQGVTGNIEVLNGSTLNGGNGNLLQVERDATANMRVAGSALTGNVQVAQGGNASLAFDRAQLNGNVAAAEGANGTLSLQNGSSLTGTVTGIGTLALDASSLTGDVSMANAGSVVLGNRSVLEGSIIGSDDVRLDTSSIRGDVTSATAAGGVALRSGAALNGNVKSNNVSLDASSLSGNITSLDGVGAVSLQRGSIFDGNLINVDRVTIGDSSVWNMAGNNSVNSLALNDGVVKFGAANEFYQLNVGNLTGNGTFIMDADYATNQHDTLNVTGSATGSHTLLIAGSGVDPVSPEPLNVVRTASGDATFALAGARAVDVGAYSYELASSANGSGGSDWFLDPSTRTISPGTQSVLALFNTAPTVWYGELTSLRSRMGELRFNGGKAGGWVRTYGNKYNVDQASGVGYQQTQQGFSLGADAPLPIGDGQWLIGVLAGHSKSDLDLTRGTSGTVKSYYAGVYTTWMDQASGYYFDGVLKLNRFRNDSKVSISDGTRAKGDYDNVGMGGSVEFGRHIKLDDGYFVEPYTQLSAVVIQGKDYRLDNDMQAEGDRTRSLLGKVGVTAGRNFTLSDGKIVQPYVRVAGVHEFAKNNKVQVNNNVFNNDLSGSRGELGAGVAVAFSDRLQMHADFDYSNGEHIEQPFGANVGLRYSW